MSITASCGHELTDSEGLGNMITTMDFSKDGTRTLCYQSVCNKCKIMYGNLNLILKTEIDEQLWIKGELDYPSSEEE